jgi:hypothetical protein
MTTKDLRINKDTVEPFPPSDEEEHASLNTFSEYWGIRVTIVATTRSLPTE